MTFVLFILLCVNNSAQISQPKTNYQIEQERIDQEETIRKNKERIKLQQERNRLEQERILKYQQTQDSIKREEALRFQQKQDSIKQYSIYKDKIQRLRQEQENLILSKISMFYWLISISFILNLTLMLYVINLLKSRKYN